MSAGNWKDMFKAAQSGDLPTLSYHIEQGADPNYQHPEVLSTPLVESIKQGHIEIVDYLLNKGADPLLKSELEGLTPLQAAKRFQGPLFIELIKQRSKPSPWSRLLNFFTYR